MKSLHKINLAGIEVPLAYRVFAAYILHKHGDTTYQWDAYKKLILVKLNNRGSFRRGNQNYIRMRGEELIYNLEFAQYKNNPYLLPANMSIKE